MRWPKSSFGLFHNILWKTWTNFLANPIFLESPNQYIATSRPVVVALEWVGCRGAGGIIEKTWSNEFVHYLDCNNSLDVYTCQIYQSVLFIICHLYFNYTIVKMFSKRGWDHSQIFSALREKKSESEWIWFCSNGGNINANRWIVVRWEVVWEQWTTQCGSQRKEQIPLPWRIKEGTLDLVQD